MFEGLFQPMHLIIVLIIVMVIFGPGKIGDLGSSLGKAIRGFQKAMQEPDKYRDLMVRVASFTAFFVDLTPEQQLDIIRRTEHQGL